MTKITSVLITGANAGLGKECARQLGMMPEVNKIYLGCRNEEKAMAAKTDLEKETGRHDDGVFEVLILDVSQPDSVKKAVKDLSTPVDGLVLNAGGKGGTDHMAMTDYGVPAVVAINILGHVLLVDELLKDKKLSPGGSVVLAGSEAARGVPTFNMKPPEIKDGSVEDFTKYVDGSFYKNKDTSFEATYGNTKFVGALYMSSMARKEPNIRFITMSPGGTAGTNVANDAPAFQRIMFKLVMPLMTMFGKMHSVETGAKRYVDALVDDKTYKTGVFYASKEGVSGPLCDQVAFMPEFANKQYQDNANEALHKFIK